MTSLKGLRLWSQRTKISDSLK